MSRFFRRIFQIASLALLATTISLCFFQIPYDHFGILIEKTYGYRSPPLAAGTHFIWSGFVPGKWKLLTIPASPRVHRIQYSQNLRLTEYLKLGDQFRLRLSLNLTTRYLPEKAATLLRITNASEDKFRILLEKRISRVLEKRFSDLYTSDNLAGLRVRIREYFDNDEGFRSDLPEIYGMQEERFFEIENWRTGDIFIPDAELYRQHLANLPQVALARRRSLIESILARGRTDDKRYEYGVIRDHARDMGDLISNNSGVAEYLKWNSISRTTNIHLSEEQVGKNNVIIKRENEESGPAVAAPQDPETGVIAPLKR